MKSTAKKKKTLKATLIKLAKMTLHFFMIDIPYFIKETIKGIIFFSREWKNADDRTKVKLVGITIVLLLTPYIVFKIFSGLWSVLEWIGTGILYGIYYSNTDYWNAVIECTQGISEAIRIFAGKVF